MDELASRALKSLDERRGEDVREWARNAAESWPHLDGTRDPLDALPKQETEREKWERLATVIKGYSADDLEQDWFFEDRDAILALLDRAEAAESALTQRTAAQSPGETEDEKWVKCGELLGFELDALGYARLIDDGHIFYFPARFRDRILALAQRVKEKS